MQKFPYFVKFDSLEGIDEFYKQMEEEGYELKKLWPSSTYTEYWLTKDEVDKVSSKSFVESCMLPPELNPNLTVATPSYSNTGRENRNVRSIYSSQADPLGRDWKWPACWGNKYQEQLGNFKSYVPYDLNIKIFGNGENVDVLVYDVAVSWDSPELSDENGVSRVVTRDWEWEYNNDNGIPNTRPKYARHPTYYSHNDTGFHSHGVQSATTIAGRYHGFANKANIYTVPVGVGTLSTLIYYNDFHKNKPKNPNTGWPNRTIMSTQVGSNGRWNKIFGNTQLNDWVPGGLAANVTAIAWTDGQIYSASNPNPSGWTDLGVDVDFGVNSRRWSSAMWNEAGTVLNLPTDSLQLGIPVTASAGNSDEWIEGRSLINGPAVQFTAANGNGIQNMTTSGIGVNVGIDAHQPVVQPDGTHARPGRINRYYTTGFRSWETGALINMYQKASFSSWGDIAMFAPGFYLISGCNVDHGLVSEAPHLPARGLQAWATNRHGEVSYNTQYGGTSGSNPVATGLMACLISGKKPGPRFTMGDFWRTADRSINNQNLLVETFPAGIDSYISYDVGMTTTANISYSVVDNFASLINIPFGTNIQDKIFGDQTLSINMGGAGEWIDFNWAIVGVSANNSAYQFINYSNMTATTGPYAPFVMVENPTFNLVSGQMLHVDVFPQPHSWLETHHPIQVRSNPDDPNTEVSWYDASAAGLIVYPPLGTTGTFWYVCTHHGAQMRGKIIITAANFNETFVLKTANTTGGTDIIQNVKYFKRDLNDFYFGSFIETNPGDPNFEGLRYPGEHMTFTIPGYNFLTIGDKYYLQSQQDISKFVTFEIMERIGNIGKTRTWAGGVPFGTTKTCHFEYERPKEKVQDMQVGQRPYVAQRKAGSNYEYNIGWGPTYPRMNRRYYNNQ